jgi:hypothetical protein
MREFFANLKAALWELVVPTYPVDDDPESTAEDVAARTAWVRSHRHPDGG